MSTRLGSDGTSEWNADVCVVGAGPTGLAVASGLAAAGARVVLVESGGIRRDERLTRRLAAGPVIGDSRFGTLDGRLNRAIGGTSWKWVIDLLGRGIGVRYAIFEDGVLARRAPGEPAWPFTFEDLEPWYDEALRFAQVGARARDLHQVPDDAVPGLDRSRYVFGPASAFQGEHVVDRLERLGVRVITGATATAIIPGDGAGVVAGVRIDGIDGAEGTVRADSVVLAAGTPDITRLLLTAQEHIEGLRANVRIGRNLMDRPRIYGTLTLDENPPEWFGEFAMSEIDGVLTARRLITPTDAAADGTASTSFLLMPAYESGRVPPTVERLVRRLLVDRPPEWAGMAICRLPDPISKLIMSTLDVTYGARSWVTRWCMATTHDTEWTGWGRSRRWRTQRTWRVTAITEQRPDDANTITLDATSADPLGVPRARLDWGTPVSLDQRIVASLTHAAEAFHEAGLGKIRWDDHLAAVSSCHMMGTVAIGTDPAVSGADPDGRVYGTTNLYVAGNAVLPQSGHNNPTLTAMALGLRTADRIVATHSSARTTASPTLVAPPRGDRNHMQRE